MLNKLLNKFKKEPTDIIDIWSNYLMDKYSNKISRPFSSYYSHFDRSDVLIDQSIFNNSRISSSYRIDKYTDEVKEQIKEFLIVYTSFYSEYDVKLIQSILENLKLLDEQLLRIKEQKSNEYEKFMDNKISNFNEELSKII